MTFGDDETDAPVPREALRRRGDAATHAAMLRHALTVQAWATMRDEGVADAAIARDYGTTVAEVRRGIAEARQMIKGGRR